MSNLKPCPWCGEIPEIETVNYGDRSRQDKYYVVCSNDDCPCQPQTYAHANKAVVVKAWNKRAKESQAQEVWFPVTKKPKKDGKYIVYTKNLTGLRKLEDPVFVADFLDGEWIFQGWENNKITNWKEMPKPPEGGEAE